VEVGLVLAASKWLVRAMAERKGRVVLELVSVGGRWKAAGL
jgi:hypothetical protein